MLLTADKPFIVIADGYYDPKEGILPPELLQNRPNAHHVQHVDDEIQKEFDTEPEVVEFLNAKINPDGNPITVRF
jgi:hypothetical protein